MKRRHWAIPLALTLLGAGCKDFLTEDPKSFITAENYYKTPADVESAVLSTYGIFHTDWGPGTGYKIQQWWTWEVAADQGRFHPDEPNAETQAPEFLNWTPTSRDSRNAWTLHYQIIQHANTALDAAGRVSFEDQDHKAALIAEAKFLRAYSYFWLARGFGGVPLFQNLDEQVRSDKPRASEAETIQMVIDDATAAAADLPWRRTGIQVGRATRAAAYTLLADAYRWKANVISNGATADWQASRDAAYEVIESGEYALTPNYLDAFLPGSHLRSEEIWSVVTFRTSVLEATSAYGAVFFPRNMGSAGIDGWAVVSPTPQFYRSYTPGDYRWEVTFRRNQCSLGSDSSSYVVNGVTSPCPAGETLVRFSPQDNPEFPYGYPHVHKYRPTDKGRDFFHGDVNTIFYRYADVLLLAAEAELALGNQPAARSLVNQIRARARNGTGGESRTEPADLATVTKDDIYRERMWELSYELGKRWFDLVQRGEEYFRAQFQMHDQLALTQGNVDAVHMRLPIPAEEIQRNRLLTQNPGY